MEELPMHIVFPYSLHFNLLLARRGSFIILLFTLLLSRLASFSRACQNFTCGDYYVLPYPFGQRGSGCGDPALQLDCDNQHGMSILNISGNQYYILNTTGYFDHRLTIIHKNLFRSVEERDCDPWATRNETQFWWSDQFHIVDNEYKNVTLCRQWENSFNTIPPKLECHDNVWYCDLTSFVNLSTFCKSQVQQEVQLPLSFKDIEEFVRNPYPILRKGFEINWKLSSSCELCESKQELCVYDPANPTESRSKSRRSRVSKIAIALGSFFGGVVLVVVLAIVYVFYVKRRKASPNRGLGSDFSSYHRSDMEAGRRDCMVGSLSIIPYQELEQATNFFDEKNELGDGGFGAVYLGKLQDGRVVAVKKLYQENSRRVEQFVNEVRILSSLCHPNLVRLYGCTCPQSPTLLLVYEFVSNGTLYDHLHGSRRTLRGGLAWGTRLNIAIEIAQALAYLHSIDPPIFHRDVKTNNILLDENFTAKVADFGLSRLVPVNVSHVTTAPQGTPGYLDPEYHQCFQLTQKSDVYSFGVVLVEIISAKVAVDITRNRSEIALANMAIDKIRRGVLDELVDPDLKIETDHDVKEMVAAVAELAFECLARDREFWPDVKEVVSRLVEIKQLQESKESRSPINIRPTASLNSVEEKLPIMSSDQRAQF